MAKLIAKVENVSDSDWQAVLEADATDLVGPNPYKGLIHYYIISGKKTAELWFPDNGIQDAHKPTIDEIHSKLSSHSKLAGIYKPLETYLPKPTTTARTTRPTPTSAPKATTKETTAEQQIFIWASPDEINPTLKKNDSKLTAVETGGYMAYISYNPTTQKEAIKKTALELLQTGFSINRYYLEELGIEFNTPAQNVSFTSTINNYAVTIDVTLSAPDNRNRQTLAINITPIYPFYQVLTDAAYEIYNIDFSVIINNRGECEQPILTHASRNLSQIECYEGANSTLQCGLKTFMGEMPFTSSKATLNNNDIKPLILEAVDKLNLEDALKEIIKAIISNSYYFDDDETND